MLKSEKIYLRILRPTDVEVMLKWENNPLYWEVSGTKAPFSKEEIEIFVNGIQDLKANQQIRYVICLNQSRKPIGTIDLFEYDAQNSSVGVGVLIAEDDDKQKGYASEALSLIIDYCRNELNAVNLFCNITKNNVASIRLFEKCDFRFVEKKVLFENEVKYYKLEL